MRDLNAEKMHNFLQTIKWRADEPSGYLEIERGPGGDGWALIGDRNGLEQVAFAVLSFLSEPQRSLRSAREFKKLFEESSHTQSLFLAITDRSRTIRPKASLWQNLLWLCVVFAVLLGLVCSAVGAVTIISKMIY